MRTMINMCDNWLRVDRIELTVFADNERLLPSIKNTVLKLKAPASALPCATASMWMRIIWRE
jgi:putative acetyltransferase